MKILYAGLAFVLSVICLLLVGLALIPDATYTHWIERGASQALGREVRAAGGVHVHSSLWPSVSVEQLRISNATWAQEKTLLTAEKLDVGISLPRLLLGQLVVTHFELTGVALNLEAQAKRTNWQFSTQQAPQKKASSSGRLMLAPVIDALTVSDVTVRYLEGRTQQKLHLATLSWKHYQGKGHDRTLRLKGRFNAQPFQLTLGTGSLIALTHGEFPVDLQFKSRGKALPDYKTYHLQGRFHADAGQYRLSNFQLAFGDNHLKGRFDYNSALQPRQLQATLQAGTLDLKPLMQWLHQRPSVPVVPASSKKKGPVFSKAALPFTALRNREADIAVTIAALELPDNVIKNIRLQAILHNDHLSVNQSKLSLFDGELSLQAKVDLKPKKPTYAVTLNTENVDLGKLISSLTNRRDLTGGKSTVDIAIKGSGQSTQEMMASMQGSSTVSITRADYKNKVDAGEASGFLKLLAGGSDNGGVGVSCVFNRLVIEKGVARSEETVMDTSGALVVGKGWLNLGNEQMDFVLSPASKSVGLADLTVPLKITGTLGAPQVYPDPTGTAATAAKTVVSALSGIGLVGGVVLKVAQNMSDNKSTNVCHAWLKSRQKS